VDTELDQLKAVLAEKRRESRDRRAAGELALRVRYKENLMAGRTSVDCECDHCLSEILALRTPGGVECAKRKEPTGKAKESITHEVVEPTFELS
jgi:hypothetical protein